MRLKEVWPARRLGRSIKRIDSNIQVNPQDTFVLTEENCNATDWVVVGFEVHYYQVLYRHHNTTSLSSMKFKSKKEFEKFHTEECEFLEFYLPSREDRDE